MRFILLAIWLELFMIRMNTIDILSPVMQVLFVVSAIISGGLAGKFLLTWKKEGAE